MATFIKGAPIAHAAKYKLFKKEGDDHIYVDEIPMKRSFANFGAINSYGRPDAKLMQAEIDTSHDDYGNNGPNYGTASWSNVSPLTKIVNGEKKYYFTITGQLIMFYDVTAPSDNVDFEATLYCDNNNIHNVKFQGLTMESVTENNVTKDYVMAQINDEKIPVYDITGRKDYWEQVWTSEIITLHCVKADYKHTDFLLIEALTNDENGNCVGIFSNEDDTGIAYFYSKPSDEYFISGGTSANELGGLKAGGYLTADQIKAHAPADAKYVVFCSHIETLYGQEDLVTVGGIFFNLGDYPNIFTKGEHKVVVKAIAGGEPFIDSEYSDAETVIID